MDVPSPAAGVVKELKVEVGDTVSEGSPDPAARRGARPRATPRPTTASRPRGRGAARQAAAGAARRGVRGATSTSQADVVVLGAGPGGYTAAFRAADLGLKTVLVERHERARRRLPQRRLHPVEGAAAHRPRAERRGGVRRPTGSRFGEPEIDVDKLRGWKDSVVGKLTGGLTGLAKQRKVEVVRGTRHLHRPPTCSPSRARTAPRASASSTASSPRARSPTVLPGMPEDDPRLMDSTGALELADIPERLLVIGGGIIGLEMATVYDALGSKVTVVELLDALIPGCDKDLVKPLQKRIEKRYEAIRLGTKVAGVEATRRRAARSASRATARPSRRPTTASCSRSGGAPTAARSAPRPRASTVDDGGFIRVDRQMRTNVPHIFAIGDIVGEPMLAHKATHEGKVAAEVIAGHDVAVRRARDPDRRLHRPRGRVDGADRDRGQGAGRARTRRGRSRGPRPAARCRSGARRASTKLLIDPETRRVLGAGMVGVNAGELIAETVHALEMGSDAEDIGLTHPPPPDAVGDGRVRRRGRRGHDHRPATCPSAARRPGSS